jgi:hypothetical protein
MVLDLWGTPQIYDQKELIVFTVSRENNYEKIENFHNKSQKLIRIMNRNWKLRGNEPETSTTVKEPSQQRPLSKRIADKISLQYALFHRWIWRFVLLANIFLIFGYSIHEGDHDNEVTSAGVGWRLVFSIMSILLSILCALRLFAFIETFGVVKIQTLKEKQNAKDDNAVQNYRDFTLKDWIELAKWTQIQILLFFFIIRFSIFFFSSFYNFCFFP